MIIASNQTLYLLALLKLKGVGPATLKKLALFPGFENKAIEDIASNIPQIARSLEGGARWDEAREWAERQVEAAQRNNAFILSAVDPEYPRLLAATKDDPFILYVQGKLAKPGQRSVAVIGTREPTHHGSLVANRITTRFGEAGWSIVSGLAIGCDGLAHQAALDCGAHTVAVMAHGLHMTAPSKHKKLAQDILASGGALISEYPFGQAAQSQQYVKRDRTQAGMALGVVMIQSDTKGGSLYASRASLEYGRWLAVPYPTDRDRERGEPKVQANLIIADAVSHERADLLRCPTTALERVIVLRNREDYCRLAESNGVEPFATVPSLDCHRASAAIPLWEPAPMQQEKAQRQIPNAEPAERNSLDGQPQLMEKSFDVVKPHGRASGDEPSVEAEPLQQNVSLKSIVGARSAGPQAADATSTIHINGVIDIETVGTIDPSTTEEPRRVCLEVKPPEGEALGAAFGLWIPPKIGSKNFKKHLGHAADNWDVREFYARHRHLHTRLAELQRKLFAAKHPLKRDQMLAFRLATEEVVLQVSKLEIASTAIEALSRAERQRVEDEDWIEKGASENQLLQPENSAKSEARHKLASDLSALMGADLHCFVIADDSSENVENLSNVRAQWMSLQLLVEQLNLVLKSLF